MMTTQLTHKRPLWLKRHVDIIQVNLPAPVPAVPQYPDPTRHPDYFPVLTALNAQRVRGQIVSITSDRPTCSEWHEVYAVELGYAWHERRVVFALVRFGG